jgi:hypothetical protein
MQDISLELGGASPSRRPANKTLIIVPNAFFAEKTLREIVQRGEGDPVGSLRDGNENFFVTYPGDSIMGRRFLNILISSDCYRDMMRGNPHSKTWFEEGVLCRLMPGGQLIVIP